MRKRIILAAGPLCLIFLLTPAGAQAVVSASNISTPSGSPVVLDPNLDDASAPVQVAGTATAEPGDEVDIYCLFDNRQSAASEGALATDVPVVGGTFAATIDAQRFDYFMCELLAYPSGGAPTNPSAFTGPIISNNGYAIDRLADPPSPMYGYYQQSSARGGYWSVGAAGWCYVGDSYPIDSASLAYDERLFGCSYIEESPGTQVPRPVLVVDNDPARLPFDQIRGPQFIGIDPFQRAVDAQGQLHVSDTEGVVRCRAACADLGDSKVRLEQTQDVGTDGHTLRVMHRWTNLANFQRQIVIPYHVDVAPEGGGWRFPGEPGYTPRTAGATVSPPPSGTGTIFVAEDPSGACPDVQSPCGSVTWFQPPRELTFVDSNTVQLIYILNVPPRGSRLVAFSYSQGFPQASVEGYAAQAESSFFSEIEFRKVKRNKRNGTAKLAVSVPDGGVLELSGAGLKPQKRTAAEAGSVRLAVKLRGQRKRELARRGKAKVKVAVAYTRTGLGAVTKRKPLKLIRRNN